MMGKINKLIVLLGLAIFICSPSFSQNDNSYIIDQVVAVVGKNVILESDIENQYLNYRIQGGIRGSSDDIRCQILEEQLFQKLMVAQAEVVLK